MSDLYNQKMVIAGDRIELFLYQGVIKTGKTYNSKGRTKGIKGNAKSRKQTLTKARNHIINLVESNKEKFKSFITLTYAENMQNLEESLKHLKAFLRKLRNDNKDLVYIYVIEYQSRGAIHYHLLTSIEVEETHSFNSKFAERYWKYGFIYLQQVNNIANISKYIACYMTKDMIETYGKKVYSHSKNLVEPTVVKSYGKQSLEEVIESFKDYKVQYTSTYQIQYDNKGIEVNTNVNYIDLIKEE
ncbi:rolling circle replication-associated protein [Clostridium perfringens]|uniref:rolling circle replication-associated protein n=1 Tax=Clostridium perfringens TaxID=1502 RepID=UPI0018E4AF50|nr:hypothetical protein [Clostridium perfringens]MBI6042190.1 hypothetical protein [Clostridium perfringens]